MNNDEMTLLREEEKIQNQPLEEMKSDEIYDMCFACGSRNPIGLHLHFYRIDKGMVAFFTPRKEHQSYDGRMHGGLISTLLDEVMGNYIFMNEHKPAYTARLDIWFRNPALIGTSLKIKGTEVKRKGPLVIMEGSVTDSSGILIAEASSHMMIK